jgi:Rrf2 family iron-sulfur cluster assembly transcriptional regulator
MITFGKTSGVAVAAMSCLAENFSKSSLSSSDIATARRLTTAHVAKVMTRLSAAGLVKGVRGPSGGYRLARAPAEISLADIVGLFEQSRSNILCPFGADWCGKKEPCPLHDRMVALHECNREALAAMTLEVFCDEGLD